MKTNDRSTVFSRYARFFWLATTLLVPVVAFLIYIVTPHEEVWHQVIYSLLCLPLFVIWVVAVIGSIISFLSHRLLKAAQG